MLKETFKVVPIFFFFTNKNMYKQLTNRGVPHQKLTSVFGNNLCFSTFQNGEQGWQANVIQFSLEKETFFHAFLSEKSCFCFVQTC